MKKKIYITILIVVLLYLVYLVVKSNQYYDVEIKCSYIGEACGDCSPQFKIDSIYQDDYNFFELEEQVTLVLENDPKTKLQETIDNCLICYKYYVKGKARKPLFENKIMLVRVLNLELKEGCCDTVMSQN